uniref:Uncharacterized protein n=1 Tax=Heterorhabditis bacteriophora TaxID=37862 RepID=A0A1I7WHX0_HETBA
MFISLVFRIIKRINRYYILYNQ